MRNQLVILAGTVIWSTGYYLDINVVQYAYVLIILGIIIAFTAAGFWLRLRDNRLRLKETMSIKKDFVEMIKQAFDFRWQRISIIWTICALAGMLLVHIGSTIMKITGPYDCAVQAIRQDRKIIERIGEVKGFTYLVSGHTTTKGYSELYFGVIGSKESITVKAVIEGRSGNYIPNKIIVRE